MEEPLPAVRPRRLGLHQLQRAAARWARDGGRRPRGLLLCLLLLSSLAPSSWVSPSSPCPLHGAAERGPQELPCPWGGFEELQPSPVTNPSPWEIPFSCCSPEGLWQSLALRREEPFGCAWLMEEKHPWNLGFYLVPSSHGDPGVWCGDGCAGAGAAPFLGGFLTRVLLARSLLPAGLQPEPPVQPAAAGPLRPQVARPRHPA